MATLAALAKAVQKQIDIGEQILALHDAAIPPRLRSALAKQTELSRAALAGTTIPEEWLSVPQIAAELSVNAETVRRWIRTGALASQTVSSHVHPRHRVKRADLDAFLQKRGSGEPD